MSSLVVAACQQTIICDSMCCFVICNYWIQFTYTCWWNDYMLSLFMAELNSNAIAFHYHWQMVTHRPPPCNRRHVLHCLTGKVPASPLPMTAPSHKVNPVGVSEYRRPEISTTAYRLSSYLCRLRGSVRFSHFTKIESQMSLFWKTRGRAL